jgi:L-iditol 2-dehydrogenase/L-idonate 5-dehydrogenase
MLGLQKAGVIEAPVASAITRELTLVGSFRFDTEIDPVIAALADGTLQVDPALTDEFPIEEGLAAMERARDSANSSKVLLRF